MDVEDAADLSMCLFFDDEVETPEAFEDDSSMMRVLREEQEEHHLRTTKSCFTIRQLPSEGLSFQLWPAASALVSFLDDDAKVVVKGKRILELGSGTGMVGVAAAMLGAHVTMTDLPHVLPNLSFNADANQRAVEVTGRGGSLHVQPLTWGHDHDCHLLLQAGGGGGFDMVLGSDLVYHDHLFDPLLRTLQFFVKEEVQFVMAHLKRWKKEAAFFKKAKKLWDIDPLFTYPPLSSSSSSGSRTGVTIHRFTDARKKGRTAQQHQHNKPTTTISSTSP
ncbi:hypothetical protein AMTRI_Chr11g151680 [Amborella trichopoda]